MCIRDSPYGSAVNKLALWPPPQATETDDDDDTPPNKEAAADDKSVGETTQTQAKKRKYTRRGTALKGESTALGGEVMLTTYALDPVFLDGLIKTLKIGWVLNASPEAGVATTTLIEQNLFSVVLCRSEETNKR